MKPLEDYTPQEIDAAVIRLVKRRRFNSPEKNIAANIATSEEMMQWIETIARDSDQAAMQPPPGVAPRLMWILTALTVGFETGYELAVPLPEESRSEQKRKAVMQGESLPCFPAGMKVQVLPMTPERIQRLTHATEKMVASLNGERLAVPEIFAVLGKVQQLFEQQAGITMAGVVGVPKGEHGHDA